MSDKLKIMQERLTDPVDTDDILEDNNLIPVSQESAQEGDSTASASTRQNASAN
ncbi:MAG: hypothetical protein SFY67_04415 [Candidatus Melainabacteria bacterium]|nr:hypothetical protein [Candidatus Melainabacteria bacterium]